MALSNLFPTVNTVNVRVETLKLDFREETLQLESLYCYINII